jgi:hypothetical protein
MTGSFDEFVALMYTDALCANMPWGKCREMCKELLTANARHIKNPRLLAF